MYIYKELVTDEESSREKNKIFRKIRMNAGILDFYLICLACGRDNFDIIDCAQLKQKAYPKKDLYIVGLAKGRESAAALAAKLYVAWMEQFGKTDFKTDLLNQKDLLFRRY